MPCPTPIHDRQGQALKRLNGRPAALASFLKGVSPRRTTPDQCAAVGRAVAQLHLQGADFPIRRANALSLEGWQHLAQGCGARADEVEPGLAAEIADELAVFAACWPRDLPGFRDTLLEAYDEFSKLADRTLALIHQALQLSEGSQKEMMGSRYGSMMRLNHYPVGDPVPETERDGLPELGETALGYHTDPGTITLLLQDNVGGLQTESLDSGWIDVPPTDGTIVINLGDCMQAWTNDRYRAAVHRVVPMTTQRRFSIPYFQNPARDSTIKPIREMCADGARYREFSWKEFMAARAYDNFTDLGTEDTQVTDFRVNA